MKLDIKVCSSTIGRGLSLMQRILKRLINIRLMLDLVRSRDSMSTGGSSGHFTNIFICNFTNSSFRKHSVIDPIESRESIFTLLNRGF